jgi:hypothetical protein
MNSFSQPLNQSSSDYNNLKSSINNKQNDTPTPQTKTTTSMIIDPERLAIRKANIIKQLNYDTEYTEDVPDFRVDHHNQSHLNESIFDVIADYGDSDNGIQDFDQSVEIFDSVVIDHVSEDDKSTSSEEITYECWTEETKLLKTRVFRDGQLIDEIIERSEPELVGNILREKLIERHERRKHISQNVLKRVRTKSPGQSIKYNLNEILNENNDQSSILIVEPTITNNKSRTKSNNNHYKSKNKSQNTYYIQHQQIITPTSRKGILFF